MKQDTTGKFNKQYTDEQLSYLKSINYLSYKDMAQKFNDRYNTDKSEKAISWIYRNYIGGKPRSDPKSYYNQKYSDIMVEWIRSHFDEFDCGKSMVDAFNNYFGVSYSYTSFKAKCNDMGMTFTNHHIFTDVQNIFLKDYCYKVCKNNMKMKDYKTLTLEFNERFNTNVTCSVLKNQIYRLCCQTKRFIFEDVHISWLEKYAMEYCVSDLTHKFNEMFHTNLSQNTIIRHLRKHTIEFNNAKFGGSYSRMPRIQKEYLLGLSPSLSFDSCVYLFNKRFHTSKTVSAIQNFYHIYKIKRYHGELTDEQKRFIEKYVKTTTYDCLVNMMKPMWSNVTRDKVIRYANKLYLDPNRLRKLSAYPIGTIKEATKPSGNATYVKRKIKTHSGWVDYDRYKYDVKDDEVIIRRDPNKFIESHDDFITIPKYVFLEVKKHGIDDIDLIKSYTLIGELKKQLELYGR